MPTTFELRPVEDSDLPSFKAYAQEAFQNGFRFRHKEKQNLT